MKLASQLENYTSKACEWLAERNLELSSVQSGRDAWTIAHQCGITRHAYDISRDITDAHIQTALEKIFPNVTFRDKKRY